MEFWRHLEALVNSSTIKIDRPQGSSHPRFADIVYPLDYGYLEGTSGGDGHGIDIWIGTAPGQQVTGIVATVDGYKRDAEQKILYACTDIEMETIQNFHCGKQQQALLVRRSDSWG